MTAILWLVWLVAAVLLTVAQARWQIDFFAHPGPAFHTAVLFALPAFLVLVAFYAWLRRAKLWCYELRLLAGFVMSGLLFYEPRATLACAWIVVVCYAFGHFVMNRAGIGGGPALEDLTISAAIGFATLIVILFLMGLAGWYYTPVFAGLLLLGSALLWRHVVAMWNAIRAVDASWRRGDELRSPIVGVAVAFAALFLICAAMVILAPSLAYDVLNMHLTSALFYWRQHALLPVPDLDYSWFPQGVEVLMTAGLMLAGPSCAQMLPPVFFLLAALLLFRIVRICGASIAGAACGVVFAASLPFLHWTGSVAKNDLAMALFELAALYCFLRWRESGRFAWIQIGVFIGAGSFGIKDVVVFGAIPLALLFILAVWRQPRRWLALASLVALFLIFGTFWQIRALLLAPHHVSGVASESLRFVSPHNTGKKILRYLEVPLQIQFAGNLAFESPLAEPMGAFLLIFAPLWLLSREKDEEDTRPRGFILRQLYRRTTPAERVCLFFIVLYLATWGVFWGVLRYSIPAVLLFCGLTGERVVRLYQRGGWPRGVVLAACSYVLVFALTGTMIIELNGPQLAYFSGRVDKAGYLRQALQTYRSLEFLNTVAAPGDAVVSLGNCSNAYAPAGVRYAAWCRASDFGTVINTRIDCQPLQYAVLLDDKPGRSLEALVRERRNLTRLFDDSHFSVYRLDSCPAAH